MGTFPLRLVALRRWDTDGREVRSVILTTFAAEEMPMDQVVHFYHQRQSIEAGFQEWKGTFHFGATRLRKYEANAAFTQLVLFAFNLVRWAWRFLDTTSKNLVRAKTRLLIRVAARCRATIRWTGDILNLFFSRGTALAGVRITFNPAAVHPYSLSKRTLSDYSRET